MSVEQTKAAVARLTPRYFLGVRNLTRVQRPLLFRDFIFNQPDIQTDKKVAYWNEINDDNPNFVPPVVTPCDDFTYIPDTKEYDQKSAKFPYVQLGATVDCDFEEFIEPDESCDGDKTLDERIRNAFMRRQMHVDRAFDNLENLWAAYAFIEGSVTIEGPGIKAYNLDFSRDECLDVTLKGNDVWGDKGCNNPFKSIESLDSVMFKKTGAITTDVFMNQFTTDKLMDSKFIVDCLKSNNPQIQIPTVVQSEAVLAEPSIPFEGAKIFLIFNRGGVQMRLWTVRAYFDFLNPLTGQKICTDMMHDGKVIGVDLRNLDTSYGARFAYGGIRNMYASPRKQNRFARSYITESGKSMKYEQESAPMPIVFNPNASWCLQVCPAT